MAQSAKKHQEGFESASSFEAGMARNVVDGGKSESTDLRTRREGVNREKIIFTKTGESVTEVSPAMSYFRVHDIMEQLTAGFERKSTSQRIDEAKELAASAGVETDTSDLEEALNKKTDMEERDSESEDEMERAVYEYLKKLAEDIVDALNQHKRSIAVIEADDMGTKTTSKLGMKGDVNFVINEQAGQELLSSLKQQDTPMRVRRKNNYGFVIQNKKLGLHMVFVFQEGLGGVKTEQKPKEEEYDDVEVMEKKAVGKESDKVETMPEDKAGGEKDAAATEAGAEQDSNVIQFEKRKEEMLRRMQESSAGKADELGAFSIPKADRQG